MTDSQAQTVKLETNSHSNMITLHFGHDHMSRTNPVMERERAYAYELPMGCHEGRVMLNRKWKQEPPMKSNQHTKLVLCGNQEKLYHWCKYHKSWTKHSSSECRKQHSERKNFKRNTGKPRSTNRQPVRGVKKITQKKPHSNTRTEQNETKTMDETHMSLRKMSKPSGSNYKEMFKILTTQLQEQVIAYAARWSGQSPNTQQDMDKRYAWKKVPPKSGEPTTKKILIDGKHKDYHWCQHHLKWTIHKPSECNRSGNTSMLLGKYSL